ncbi:hypothetical protein B0H34DRAFT_848906 [Crassisporium funariophilum]|nr:hypothetical protein B0H34DRAFT_848906 [Crassisporium funariophilum]
MSFDFFRRKNAESPLAWQMQKDGWEEGIIVNPPRPRGIEIGEAGAQPSRQAVFRTHGSSVGNPFQVDANVYLDTRELFLSSTHLPLTPLASFVERRLHLSLTAPPAAIIMIIPFTYDMLKHQSALMGMIHCSDVDDDSTFALHASNSHFVWQHKGCILLKEQPLYNNTRQDGGASMKHH